MLFRPRGLGGLIGLVRPFGGGVPRSSIGGASPAILCVLYFDGKLTQNKGMRFTEEPFARTHQCGSYRAI